MKGVFKSFLRYIRKTSEKVGAFLERIVAGIPRFLHRPRKPIFLVIVIVLVTLAFTFLIASWIHNDANNQTVSTTGTINVRDLEIYGGDVRSKFGKNYIDWGELSLGASKNVSFYVQSTANFDVALGLNVTGWTPLGIEDYITISWDYTGFLLSPDQEPLLVTVNLNVSSSGEFINYLVTNEVTEFSLDITIYASGLE